MDDTSRMLDVVICDFERPKKKRPSAITSLIIIEPLSLGYIVILSVYIMGITMIRM